MTEMVNLPVSTLKHLKELSQNPQTKTVSLVGRAAKQAEDGERVWSRDSPRRSFRPLSRVEMMRDKVSPKLNGP